MLRLILFLIFLLASVWLGVDLVKHPGYLLLVYQPWLVQMPLWFALLSAFILLSLFYLLITSCDGIQFLWYRLKNHFRLRAQHKALNNTQQGLLLLLQGEFKKAERLLQSGIHQTQEPLINYLALAKAAHEQGAFDKRDMALQKAYKIAPQADLAIGLLQAEFELQQNQFEIAAATLTRLHHAAPKQPRVLALLEKVSVHLGDWKNLQLLLPNLLKQKIITKEQYAQFQKNIYAELLRSTPVSSLASLQKNWRDVPRALRKNPDVVCAYVEQLQRFSAYNDIEPLIRYTLKNHYQPALVTVYGTLPFTQLNKQLVIVGAWLKLYGKQPALLLLLADLCMRLQLWGKAKDYFKQCLALGPDAKASLDYGKLLEKLGEKDEAMQQYRKGLMQFEISIHIN